MKVCCFSGHRPGRFPWGTDESNGECRRLKGLLKKEIERAVSDGFTHFIAGGAAGVDTWAADIVSEMKRGGKVQVTLEIAVPFTGYNQYPGRAEEKRKKQAYGAADRVTVVSEMKSTLSYYERNRYMVDRSQRLIAIYDEGAGLLGGTYHTLRYARAKGIEIRQIGWL